MERDRRDGNPLKRISAHAHMKELLLAFHSLLVNSTSLEFSASMKN